jgi:hypothetical protein
MFNMMCCCVPQLLLLLQARLALDDAGDVVPVARALTSLLLPSYYPQGADVTGEEQVHPSFYSSFTSLASVMRS